MVRKRASALRFTELRFTDEERLRTSPVSPDREHVERFTDEEAAVLRQLRFGTLPEAVPPADWVTEVDTDAPYEPPEQRQWPPYDA